MPVATGRRNSGHLPAVLHRHRHAGSRVTEAWFAALAIEWGGEWITLDRDYAASRV